MGCQVEQGRALYAGAGAKVAVQVAALEVATHLQVGANEVLSIQVLAIVLVAFDLVANVEVAAARVTRAAALSVAAQGGRWESRAGRPGCSACHIVRLT